MYVGLGGFLGAVARYGLGQWLGGEFFPYGTLAANLTGCFTMGLLGTLFLEKIPLSIPVRTGITTGFIGAYTTFSAFGLETVNMLQAGRTGHALGYILISNAAGLLLCRLGMVTAGLLAKHGFRRDTSASETGSEK